MKVLSLLFAELMHWSEAIVRNIPGLTGVVVRKFWYKLRFGKVQKIYIGDNCRFICPSKMLFKGLVSIGDNAYFNADGGIIDIEDGVLFNTETNLNASCGGRIQIGINCLIGPGVVMRTANHIYSDPGRFIRDQGHDIQDIIIEDDCWIGSNVIVLGGVKVGRGSVVGAGSIITKDIPSMSIAVGVPARVIKFRE